MAGAVAQTGVFDYRRAEGGGCASFGTPVSSVEVKLLGGEGEVGGPRPEGELTVRGPAVSGEGWVGLGVRGGFGEDGCLGLA